MPVGRPKNKPIEAEYVEVDSSTGEVVPADKMGRCNYPDLPQGENARIIATLIKIQEIAQHADSNNIDSLYWCFQQYMELCQQMDIKITNMSAYAACGIDRVTVSDWAHARKRRADPRYQEFALYIQRVCSEYREMLMAEGKIHPVTGIWWQKNYDSFSDKPAELPPSTDAGELTSSEIANKYRDLPDE